MNPDRHLQPQAHPYHDHRPDGLSPLKFALTTRLAGGDQIVFQWMAVFTYQTN